jgi:NTP pyrophosphatase (non-canonical NTP hydrolase)
VDLNEFQDSAQATDQAPGTDGRAIVVPLLGIAGEAGALLTQYKKLLRDGPAYTSFRDQVAEELGDILWYVANLATKFNLRLEDLASANLAKTSGRWGDPGGLPPTQPILFDESYPESERFPRQMVVEIAEGSDEHGIKTAVLTIDGKLVGNQLNDNAMVDDGYRFHDVMHLTQVGLLGWSPTIRGLMRRKRKSNPQVDHAEDGARAVVVDEAIVEMVFDYARGHEFLDGVGRIDYELLGAIRRRTAGLEVGIRSAAEWEHAILESYRTWRSIRAKAGGRFRLDLVERKVELLD